MLSTSDPNLMGFLLNLAPVGFGLLLFKILPITQRLGFALMMGGTAWALAAALSYPNGGSLVTLSALIGLTLAVAGFMALVWRTDPHPR